MLGRHRWFWIDDWDFVANRSLRHPSDLFDDHYGHWSTLPIIAFRALWAVVGLRSYLPYLTLAVLLHLAGAVLLRALMRRAGVNAWIATAAASAFALFGTGWQNIEWAFQIGFIGALVLGLIHLLLVDHEGPVDKRDWLGLACGIGALMSSGVGVTMAVIVSVAALIQRGYRVALLHAAPLAVVYLTWWAFVGRTGAEQGPSFGRRDRRAGPAFCRDGLPRRLPRSGPATGYRACPGRAARHRSRARLEPTRHRPRSVVKLRRRSHCWWARGSS